MSVVELVLPMMYYIDDINYKQCLIDGVSIKEAQICMNTTANKLMRITTMMGNNGIQIISVPLISNYTIITDDVEINKDYCLSEKTMHISSILENSFKSMN